MTSFYLLFRTVSIIVGIFIAWGTLYDVSLSRKMKEKVGKKMVHSDSSGLNCTTYDLTGAISDKKISCVGIGMPTGMNNNNSDENLAIEPVIVEDKKLCEFSTENLKI